MQIQILAFLYLQICIHQFVTYKRIYSNQQKRPLMQSIKGRRLIVYACVGQQEIIKANHHYLYEVGD